MTDSITSRTSTIDSEPIVVPAPLTSNGATPTRISPANTVAIDRVKRGAPLLGPVDVAQVDPQRELVEGEADADPEQPGQDLAQRALGIPGEVDEPRDHHQH